MDRLIDALGSYIPALEMLLALLNTANIYFRWQQTKWASGDYFRARFPSDEIIKYALQCFAHATPVLICSIASLCAGTERRRREAAAWSSAPAGGLLRFPRITQTGPLGSCCRGPAGPCRCHRARQVAAHNQREAGPSRPGSGDSLPRPGPAASPRARPPPPGRAQALLPRSGPGAAPGRRAASRRQHPSLWRGVGVLVVCRSRNLLWNKK